MESQSLEEYLSDPRNQALKSADLGPPTPWYNTYGDCIEYQTDQVAIVADRIDNFLTIYRSGETDNAIGFQLKDVKSLMKKYQAGGLHVMCEVKNAKIASVTSLLLTALEAGAPLSIKKRSGYQEAMKNLADSKDLVSLEDCENAV